MSLKDKVIVVTGASRGIGRALARGFAADDAIVVVAARTLRPGTGVREGSLEETVQQITEAGGKAVAIPCDVAEEDQIKTLVERTLAEVGPIDVLVNNAAHLRAGPIVDFDVADWDRVMAVTVRGPFLTCRYILPGMMERRQGSIINFSSHTSIRTDPETPVYGAAKAALDRFTLNLALDMEPYNIAVNGLRPGRIASHGWSDQFGRIPSPPEVVIPPVLWLAQQDASTFTGHVVHRDEFGKTWP